MNGLNGIRQFRFDVVNESARLTVDCDGNRVVQQNVSGSWLDAEKINEARRCGWMLIRGNAKTVENGKRMLWVENR